MRPPSLPQRSAPFFSPDINNATGVSSATEAKNESVVSIASDADNRPVAESATDKAINSPVAVNVTVALLSIPGVAQNATVENNRERAWKLRPLRRITDGLTPGQYAVYSLMFENSETAEGGERLYLGGYADIGRLTGLSKRGIQNVIGELQEKGVLRLHRAPGHHRLQTSGYIVLKAESVLAGWFARGWRFATGKSKRLTNGTTVAVSEPQPA
jgi:hypothetical protein